MALYGLLTTQGERDAADDLAKKQAYQPLLRQMPTTAAAALGPLLSAKDEGAQRQGISLLEEYFRRNSPQGRQLLQNAQDQGYATRQQVDMAASEEARRNQLFPGQLKAQDYAASQARFMANQDRRQGEESEQRLKLNDLALQAAMAPPAPPTDAQIFEQAAGFPLPKDYIAGFNPNTKELEPIPAPNTEPYRKAAAEVDTGEKLSRTITRYLALVDAVGPTGTELIGPKAGALRSAREDVISAYRERAALGTPTGGELARVEDILPDPTGYYRNSWSALGALGTAGLASGYIKESQMSPYRELLEAVTQDLDTKYKRNWWIPPTPGIRAP